MCLPFWQSALYTSNPMAGVAMKCSIKDGYIISTGIFEPNITEVFLFPAFIKGRVEGIVIFRVKGIQNTAERFAKPLVMHDFSGAKELDHIADIGVVGQAENVVIGQTGFLFRSKVLVEVCDGIPGRLERCSGKGIAGGIRRVKAGCVIDKVSVESALFNFVYAQVAGQLINQGADHLNVGEFFSPKLLSIILRLPGKPREQRNLKPLQISPPVFALDVLNLF